MYHKAKRFTHKRKQKHSTSQSLFKQQNIFTYSQKKQDTKPTKNKQNAQSLAAVVNYKLSIMFYI